MFKYNQDMPHKTIYEGANVADDPALFEILCSVHSNILPKVQAFGQLPMSSIWATALVKHLGNFPCQKFGQQPLSCFFGRWPC